MEKGERPKENPHAGSTLANFMETESIQEDIKILTAYAFKKLASKDWHAVADAAMDIRELEAKLEILERKNK